MSVKRIEMFHPAVSVAGCDPEGLVRVSETFAELELEMVRRREPSATQVAVERADWGRVGTAMGRVYQTLCDGDQNGTMNALQEIEHILAGRGVLVPQPIIRTPEAMKSEVQDGE